MHEIIKCKIIEVGTNEIKYIPSDNLTGPSYSIAREKVAKIEFDGGKKEEVNGKSNDWKDPELYRSQLKKAIKLINGKYQTEASGGITEKIEEINGSLGFEYWYQNQFAFRAGYFYENPNKGNRKFLSVGAGLKYNTFGLNFAYLFPSGSGTNRNPLSNTYRFGLVFDFGAAK